MISRLAAMLLRLGHTHVEMLSVQHKCCIGLANYLRKIVHFLSKMKDRGSSARHTHVQVLCVQYGCLGQNEESK